MRDEFQEKWAKQIKDDRRLLLSKYRDEISFPTPPFQPENITTYLAQANPLLHRSRQARMSYLIGGGMSCAVGLVLVFLVDFGKLFHWLIESVLIMLNEWGFWV